MRMPGVPFAVATYPIPPFAPEPVAEAKAEFDRIAAQWADAKGLLEDAREALAEAKRHFVWGRTASAHPPESS